MKTLSRTCTAIACLTLPISLAAQDQPGTTPTATDPAPLIEALGRLHKSDSFTLRGSVREEQPDDENIANGVMVVSPGRNAKSFSGKFEVLRPRPGETLIVSEKALPGIAIYEMDDRRIARHTIEDEALSSKDLSNTISDLMDLPRLRRAIAKAKAKIKTVTNDKTGETRWKMPLGRRLVRASGGIMGRMARRVLQLRADIVTDKNGNLVSMTFKILRSDPMAEMRKQALAGKLGGAVNAADIDEGDTPGKTMVLRLQPSDKATKRATTLLGELRKLSEGSR